MRRLELRVFRGPNLFGKRSLARLTIASGPRETVDRPELERLLAACLPEGSPGWQQVATRLGAVFAGADAVPWVEFLGVLAVELQEDRYQTELGFRAERLSTPTGVGWQLLIDIQDAELGQLAATFACTVVAALQSAANTGALAVRTALELHGRTYFRTRSAIRFNWITAMLADAATARGVPVAKLLPTWPIGLFGQGHRSQRLWECSSDETSSMAGRISHDKACTSALLRHSYIPIATQLVIRSLQDMDAAVRELGFPLVVKGRNTDHGKSVTTGITSLEELKRAIGKVRSFDDQLIIEKHVPGADYRFTLVNFKLVAAARRSAAQVVGDGASSIAQLVVAENARRRSHGRYARWIVPLTLDPEARAILAREGLDDASIPAAGQSVVLRSAANLSLGGLAEDVTDQVHPDVVSVVERAARVVRLDLAGIDLITTDVSRPLSETGGVILEINGRPGLRPHYVTSTPARDVAGAVIDYLFPEPHRGRIPSVVVTGTNGKTTTCRMMARIFEASGLMVGMTSTSGISIGGSMIVKGDRAGSRAAAAVLRDPAVQAAVLEMARGGVLKGGLGVEHFDVGIVTNVTLDHLGMDGIDSVEEMARIKRLIVEPARRAIVLNADDAHCAAMAKGLTVPVWWVSRGTEDPLITAHAAAGGNAVIVMDLDGVPTLVHRAGDLLVPIVEVAEIPATLDGTATHNIENALCAAAAALALDQPLEAIRQALTTFHNSFEISPGRLNIHDADGVRIIVDYVHNEGGMRKIVETLNPMPVSGRRRCLLLAPRSKTLGAEVYDWFAQAAAQYFDTFVVAEVGKTNVPIKPFQRPLGRSADLMVSGLGRAGVPAEHIHVVLDSELAIDAILADAHPGDLVLLAGTRDHPLTWAKATSFRLASPASTVCSSASAD